MKHKNRVIAFLMTFVMIISQFAGNALTVHAEPGTVNNVKYLDDKGISKNCAEATVVTDGDTAWNDGWYAVTADTTCESRITVTGTVHLILCDKKTLTATEGITVNTGNSLYIYAQSTGEDAGALIATAYDYVAGIGGGDSEDGGTIIINGGKVTATGGVNGAGIGGGRFGAGGTIKINGGDVTANGGKRAAGIGGGYDGDGGEFTINGGDVTATGGDGAAGIGGGYEGAGGTIIINGGNVTATDGIVGAGIGGGQSGAGGTIIINGGNVSANGGKYGAGIGGGRGGNGGTITINGGKVTANGGEFGAGIGGGNIKDGGNITINGGEVIATGGDYGAGIGGGEHGPGGEITINGGKVTANGGRYGAGIGGGREGAGGNIAVSTNVLKLVAHKKSNDARCIGEGRYSSSSGKITFKNGDNILEGDAKKDFFYDTEKENTRIIRSKLVNHSITIAEQLKESINANTAYAYEGETVMLTMDNTEDVAVRSEDGDLSLIDEGEGKYTFKMPGKDVRIKMIPTYTLPENKTISCKQTLKDIVLPDGFTFADQDQALVFGDNTVELTYNPDPANYFAVENIVISVNKAHHILSTTAAKAATCTEAGNIAGWTCDVCGKHFSDADGKTEIEEGSWVISAGHHLIATAAKAETCTVSGNNAYWTCDVCGKYFSDADGKTEIEADSWVIPALGHHLTETAAKAETCTEAGNSAYWTCDVCGKHFSDADGKTEIEEDSWVVPASGHKWGEWKVVKEASETEEGIEERVCENDNTHKETRVIPKKEKKEEPQPETPKPDTQIPMTPSVNKSVKINDADVSVSINITYPKAVNWTGSKISLAQLAVLVQDGEIAKVKIEGLEKAIAALNKDADLSKLIKVSYVIGKKKKVGEKGSFYVKLSLNSKVCKKAKIKGKDKKALETLIKDINKEFKAHPYEFDIVPIDISDVDAIESVSLKAGFKNGELQLNEDGSLKKLKSLKIKVKIPGKKKAKTYTFSGKKITKSFTVKLTDPAAKKAELTALDGQNFKGSRSGVEIVK